MIKHVFRGALSHCVRHPSKTEHSCVELIANGLVAVDESGKIAALCRTEEEAEQWLASHQDVPIQQLEAGQLLLPGFVDTHTHAPQFAFTGTGQGIPLLKWLDTVTFPMESRFDDVDFANHVYDKCVRRLLKNGTTTATYFATLHTEASLVLARICSQLGQRAYVGRVSMDRNSPDYYVEEQAAAASEEEAFVRRCLQLNNESEHIDNSLVQPIVTPRFVPTCSSELMHKLGEIAEKYNLLVQSHISEQLEEIDFVRDLHPDCDGYAEVYRRHGLLNSRTVQAHAIYLTPEEVELFRNERIGIAHCPSSNFAIQSGTFNSADALDADLKVGLGTDVAGGYSPSMLDAMRQALIASSAVHTQRMVQERRGQHDDHVLRQGRQLDWSEALWLATMGGAEVLNRNDIGNFEVGKLFDAMIVDFQPENGPLDIFEHDSLQDRLQKFIFNGDDRNIAKVFVQGNLVVPFAAGK
ncbi:MAG: hypothetical protein MHM6MM_000016 [Cercozoa sp. M6MM]